MDTNPRVNKVDEEALGLAVFKRDYAAFRRIIDPAFRPVLDETYAEMLQEAEAELSQARVAFEVHACATERVP